MMIELNEQQFNKAVRDYDLEIFDDSQIQLIKSRLNSDWITLFHAELIEKAKRDLSKLIKVKLTDKNGHSVYRWVKNRNLKIDKKDRSGDIKKPTTDPVKWLKPRLEELADAYIESTKNSETITNRKKMDPDEARNVFRSIGYDGTNVPAFRDAEKMLIDRIYEKRMLESENKTINFMTGNGGSGKGFSTRNFDFSDKDIIFDSAFNSFKSIKKVLDKAQDKGFEMSVVAVYNDPVTSLKNTINRGKTKGRWFSVGYLVSSYQQNIKKIKEIKENYPNVKITTIDNKGNNGYGEIPVEQAIADWNYAINVKQREQLIKLVENEKGRIAKNEYANLSEGLSDLKRSIGARHD